MPDKILAYLSAALNLKQEDLEKRDWLTCMKLFNQALARSPKIDVPIIKNAPKDGKDADWDYPGRSVYHYTHILASAYGWDAEYIANLEVQEAMALIQEIMTDKHLDEEFLYSLSEIAYPYNKSTKKHNFKPLVRPYWMRPIAPPMPKKVRMRRDMLPVGRIVDISGLPDQFQIEGLETEKPK